MNVLSSLVLMSQTLYPNHERGVNRRGRQEDATAGVPGQAGDRGMVLLL